MTFWGALLIYIAITQTAILLRVVTKRKPPEWPWEDDQHPDERLRQEIAYKLDKAIADIRKTI